MSYPFDISSWMFSEYLKSKHVQNQTPNFVSSSPKYAPLQSPPYQFDCSSIFFSCSGQKLWSPCWYMSIHFSYICHLICEQGPWQFSQCTFRSWSLLTHLHPLTLVQAIDISIHISAGFPSGSVGKESACNAGVLGSISTLGRSPGEGNGQPLQGSCL